MQNRTQIIQSARAAAEGTKLTGKAEARAMSAIGDAEATQMRLKANAYQRFLHTYHIVTLISYK